MSTDTQFRKVYGPSTPYFANTYKSMDPAPHISLQQTKVYGPSTPHFANSYKSLRTDLPTFH